MPQCDGYQCLKPERSSVKFRVGRGCALSIEVVSSGWPTFDARRWRARATIEGILCRSQSCRRPPILSPCTFLVSSVARSYVAPSEPVLLGDRHARLPFESLHLDRQPFSSCRLRHLAFASAPALSNA